jgi:hypothetical protein
MSDPVPHAATALLDRAEAELKVGHLAAGRALLADPAAAGDAERRAKLWARLAPDPLVAWLIAGCLLLFFALVSSTAH